MKNRPGSSRIFGALLAVGAMFGLRSGCGASGDPAPISAPLPVPQANTPGLQLPSMISNYGATPDVWGQSRACRRMVQKNFLARRARS